MSSYLPVSMHLAHPLPHSTEKLCELRADLEHELAVAVRAGDVDRQHVAAVAFVLHAVEQRLDRAATRPSVQRRATIAAERRPSTGNGR